MSSSPFLAVFDSPPVGPVSLMLLMLLMLLILLMAAAAIWHYFRIRQRPGFSAWPLIPAVVLLAAAIWLTVPMLQTASSRVSNADKTSANVTTANVEPISNSEMLLLM